MDNLHHFDELGTVLSPKKKDIKGKSTNKGELCMMLDPDADYTKDTCRMWNIKTRKAIIIRDIFWLKQLNGKYYGQLDFELQANMIPTDDEDQESTFQVDVGDTHETTEIPDNNNNVGDNMNNGGDIMNNGGDVMNNDGDVMNNDGDVMIDDGNDGLTPNANYYLWL